MKASEFISFPKINDIEIMHKLKIETIPLWGSMHSQQMIEHLTDAIMLSIGEFESTVFTEKEKVDKIKRMFIDSDLPFRKDFKSPIFRGEGIIFRNPSLAVAIKELESYIVKFEAYYNINPNKTHVHPVFGMLSKADWERFHSKHFTHHFKQFGLVS